MFKEFKSLPLTSSFESDINDFLFESISTPPLPASVTSVQPIVNTQANLQQRDPITNLTRTQQALLSPEEQIIASRKT